MAKNIEKVSKVPNLRFPRFEDEWKTEKLGDLMDFKVTNSFSRDMLNYEKGKVKNIHYGDIHTKFQTLFDITKETVPYINEEISIDRISEDFYCKEGDIIFADASEDLYDVGKSIEIKNLDNQKLLSGLHTLLARPKENHFYKGFNGYLFQSNNIRYQIQKESQGSKVLSISVKRTSKVKLTFPSVIEQEKITKLLSLIDERIQSQKKIISELETLIKGFSKNMFRQKIKFKDENGGDFPKWETKKLGEITKFYDGTHQTPKYLDSGIPFYSVEHLTGNQFIKTKYISEKVFQKENIRVKLEKGDILMTRIGDIGTVKYIDWEVSASFYVSLSLIKQNKNFDSQYLSYYMKSNNFQNELWKRTIHVAFPKKINLGEIGFCKVSLPCFEEQNKIASILSKFDKKLETEKHLLNELKEQKKYLLQNLFI